MGINIHYQNLKSICLHKKHFKGNTWQRCWGSPILLNLTICTSSPTSSRSNSSTSWLLHDEQVPCRLPDQPGRGSTAGPRGSLLQELLRQKRPIQPALRERNEIHRQTVRRHT